MSDPARVVILVGLPGSGKSFYLDKLHANAVSSDDVRRQLLDNESDQTANGAVFATVRYMLRKRIELKRPITFVDATNVTRRVRKPFIRIAKEGGCRVEAIWFDVPLAICRERNAARHRVVPDFVLEHMAARLVPPSLEEGFEFVERVTNGTTIPA